MKNATAIDQEILNQAVLAEDDELLAEIESQLAGEEEPIDEMSDDDIDKLDRMIAIDEAKAGIFEPDEEPEEVEEPEEIDEPVVEDAAPTVAPTVAPVATSSTSKKKKTPEDQIQLIRQIHSQPILLNSSELNLSDQDKEDASEKHLHDFQLMAKKSLEKIVNLYSSLFGTKSLSVYTKMAVDFAKEKHANGEEFNSRDIEAMYKDKGYKVGTAKAQTSQMMQVLSKLEIIKSTPTSKYPISYTLNEDSVLLAHF